uniref:Uncharacterized protein n=1 Tax=Rhizophora mucronata TaxID=61149 RepID=A0A2P2Q1D3_RHIMU
MNHKTFDKNNTKEWQYKINIIEQSLRSSTERVTQ